jgi:hypothetical protein
MSAAGASTVRTNTVRVFLACSFGAVLFVPVDATAQHEHHEMAPPEEGTRAAVPHGGMEMISAPLDIPPSREGSGTSWLPDESPMYMFAWLRGGWELDAMWNVFLQYVDDRGPRGRSQLGSVNWVMGMARTELGGGQLRARAMLSVEPWSVGRCGYPDLLATGELCRGSPLHDTQHPHDAPMELSAGYAHAVSSAIAVDLYAALAGEPALGPVAFPHRPSAMPSPIAPMTHHWMDSTHISFGVVTAGVYGRRWKAEGSAFNGREPDDRRWDLDLGPLDSFAGRVWFVPDGHWSLQASAGFLREVEEGIAGALRSDVTRTTASAIYARNLGMRGTWTATAAWGRNSEHGKGTNALLLETAVDPDGRNVAFMRLEAAEKSPEALVLGNGEESRLVGKATLTYVRQVPIALGTGRQLLLGLGAGLSLSAVPSSLEPAYGSRFPLGFEVFLSTRPGAMGSNGMAHH